MRASIVVLLCAVVGACGPRFKPTLDGGEELDAGVTVDAGRPRGDDPPKGWSTALALPAGAAATTRLGVSVASVPDRYNQPLLAALSVDPNGDGDFTDNKVIFSRWDGVTKTFTTPLLVEVVGDVALDAPHRPVNLARDSATGQIAIAYVKGAASIRLATSDDEGANFSLVTVATSQGGPLYDAVVGVRGGVAHVAWIDGTTLNYATRTGAGAFAAQAIAPPSGMAVATTGAATLAVDSVGHAGVAFFANPSSGPGPVLAFWRPGMSSAVAVVTPSAVTAGQLALKSVSLVFSGELPRVAFHLRLSDPLASADNTPELYFAAASDSAGSTWSTPVPVPRNGDSVKYNSTGRYQSVVVEDSGKVSVAANFLSNGTPGALCGGPKLARSDTGASFSTCSPAQSPYNFAGDSISAWAYAPGKLTLVFFYDERANPSAKAGIELWREP